MKYPLVQVEWLDAQTSHGWEAEGEVDQEVPLVTTVGFLIIENEHLLCLASTVGKDRSHNSRITIPVGMVKTKKILRK